MMTRSFGKFCGAVAIVLSLASASFAQESTSNDIIRPITKQGSAGFLFTINGLGVFGISSPPIGVGSNAIVGAGMRYYLADDLALRVLLAFQNASTDSNTINGAPKTSSTSFGIGAGVEHHFRPLYSISPYVGGQVGFTSSTNSTGTASEVKHTNSQFSVAALGGFDWYFTRGIAIGAEVGLGFASNSTSSSGTTADIISGGVRPFGKTTASEPTSLFEIFTNSDIHLFVHF